MFVFKQLITFFKVHSSIALGKGLLKVNQVLAPFELIQRLFVNCQGMGAYLEGRVALSKPFCEG